MKYEVRLTQAAQADLGDIFRYIAISLQSPQTASEQLDRLESAVKSLDEMPERCRLYDRQPWNSRNVRIMPVDHYVVFYVPNHDDATVTVLRILCGGRDMAEQLLWPQAQI